MTDAPVGAEATFSFPFVDESPRERFDCLLDATAACAMISFMSSFATLADASFHGLAGVSGFGVKGVISSFGRNEVSRTSAPIEEGSPSFASGQIIAPPFPKGKLDVGLAYSGLGGAQTRLGVPRNESCCFS